MLPAAAVNHDLDADLAVAGMLGGAVDTATTTHPGVRVRARVEHSTAAVALIQHAAEASLVVLGGRRPTGVRAWLGSTSGSVSAHARCPVVVVRGEPRVTDPVVAGVDESEVAGPVLGFAFEQAAVRGVPVRAVHGWSPPDGRDLLCDTNLRAVAEERGRLEAMVGCWRRRFPGVPVSAEVVV